MLGEGIPVGGGASVVFCWGSELGVCCRCVASVRLADATVRVAMARLNIIFDLDINKR